MQQELLSGVLVYPIISISGHCHSYSRTVLIPEFPSKGNRLTLARSLVPFPAFSSLALLLPEDGIFFSDSPQCEVLGLINQRKGFYFLWVIKRNGVNVTCFLRFLANWGVCPLEYVYYWVSNS